MSSFASMISINFDFPLSLFRQKIMELFSFKSQLRVNFKKLTVSTSCMFALLMCDSYCDQLANQKSEIILLMSLNTQKALS